MKSLKIKLSLMIGAAVFGVLAFVVFEALKTTDDTIHAVKLCDLMLNAERYDGKRVRLQAFYFQGTERLNLGDNDPSCAGAGQLRADYTDLN